MIELGYILPDGTEVDLTGYSNLCGSVHLEYADNYLSRLPKINPELYEAYRKFAWNVWREPETDFLLSVLGWIKVGEYSMPRKVITYTPLSDTECLSGGVRSSIINKYIDEGYSIRLSPRYYQLDKMEEAPDDYFP